MSTFLKVVVFILVSCQFVFAQAEYGIASYYSDKFHDSKTANGERYDKGKMTAAHRTLPFNTKIKVTNLDNQKSVVVRVNDRGPFVKGYIVDLSRVAAQSLNIIEKGIEKVKIEVISSSEPAVVETPVKVNTEPIVINTPAPKPKPELGKNNPTKPSLVKGSNLFKVHVQEITKAEYGVQIGSYSQYENILRQISNLQEKWFKNTMVYVSNGNGQSVYKLILGPFPNKALAASYLKDLKDKNIDGFVVELSKLK